MMTHHNLAALRFRLASLLAILLIGLAPVSRALAEFENLYTAGHADIRPVMVGDALRLQFRFAPGAVVNGSAMPAGQPVSFYQYAPTTVTTVVSDDAKTLAPSDIPFLGAVAGQPIWILPQINAISLPFLGFSTEDLESTDFGSVTWGLAGVTGPGNFALWQSTPFGSVTVRWQSNNGLNASDQFVQGSFSHDHYNWGFSAPGLYELRIQASTTSPTLGLRVATDTFRFQVGPSVIPEPSAWALMAIGATLLGLRRMVGRSKR